MRVTCLNKYLKEAIIIAERNTSKNQTLPILGSVFLKAEDNKLQIRATNLETAVELVISCSSKESGSLVIPAKTFNLFLSNIQDEQISLQSQKENLLVKTSATETIIRGYPIDEFPLFPKVEPISSFNIAGDQLRECLSLVVVACSVSDIKPELSSVLFKIFKNTIKFTATDSFRLAEKTITSKTMHSDKQFSFLVPQKSIQEILRMLTNNEEAEVGFSKNQMILKNKSFKFISRLTEGFFPDYEQLIPKNFKTEALIEQKEVIKHMKLASVFVGRLNEVSLNFDPQKKSLIFSSSNPDIGEHSSELKASIQGDEVLIKFNWKYLFDGMSQIPSEYISFNLNGEDSPLLIKGKGDNLYLYLAMPMRG